MATTTSLFTKAANYSLPEVVAWDVTASETVSLIAQYAYVKVNLSPFSSTGGYAALISAAMTINPNIKFGVYTIAYEFSAGQASLVQSITRSGSVVTVTTTDEFGAPAPPDAAIVSGQPARIANSTVAAYNATWAVTAVAGNTWTFTATGAALTAADDTTSQAICCGRFTATYFQLDGPAANPSWWLWKQGVGGRRTFWATFYDNFNMNMTAFAQPDTDGNYWPQWVGKWYSDNLLTAIPGFKFHFAFLDNTIDPRGDAINDAFTFSGFAGSSVHAKADWKGLGGTSWQNITDADILAAHRSGCVAFGDQMRANTGAFAMANHDSSGGQTLPGPLAHAFESAFFEFCLDVRSITLAQWIAANFATRMATYAAYEGKLLAAPGIVVLDAFLDSSANFEAARFIQAMSWMRDIGRPLVRYAAGSRLFYDEALIPRGNPVDPPQSAASVGPIWVREWQGMLVLINPSTQDASIDLSNQRWSTFDGTLDPGVNTDQKIYGAYTVPAGTARVLQENAVQQPRIKPMLQAFQPQGLTQLIVATTTPSAAIPITGSIIGARLKTDNAAYFACSSSQGSSNMTCTIPTTDTSGNGVPLLGSSVETLNLSPSGWLSFVTSAGTANINYTPGFGV